MYRIAAAIAVATPLFLVWTILAVGIIGNESNPANLIYFAVLAVSVTGTFIVRGQPDGMARTLLASADRSSRAGQWIGPPHSDNRHFRRSLADVGLAVSTQQCGSRSEDQLKESPHSCLLVFRLAKLRYRL